MKQELLKGNRLKKCVAIIRSTIMGRIKLAGISLSTTELDFILNLTIIEMFKFYNKEKQTGKIF